MRIGSPTATRITRPSSLNALISDYTRRYANPRTAYRVAWYLHDMFDHARPNSPASRVALGRRHDPITLRAALSGR
jgi:hypothetical protein